MYYKLLRIVWVEKFCRELMNLTLFVYCKRFLLVDTMLRRVEWKLFDEKSIADHLLESQIEFLTKTKPENGCTPFVLILMLADQKVSICLSFLYKTNSSVLPFKSSKSFWCEIPENCRWYIILFFMRQRNTSRGQRKRHSFVFTTRKQWVGRRDKRN